MSNMPRWQNFNPVYAKKAIHRYVTSPRGQNVKHAKMAKSESGIRQEGYTTVCDKPKRAKCQTCQDGKILIRYTPRRLYTGMRQAQEGKMSNMPRWQNLNPVYAKKAIHRYVTSPRGQNVKHAKMAKS